MGACIGYPKYVLDCGLKATIKANVLGREVVVFLLSLSFCSPLLRFSGGSSVVQRFIKKKVKLIRGAGFRC